MLKGYQNQQFSLLLLIFFANTIDVVEAQSSISNPQIDTTETGLVYLLLVILFSIAYGVPIVLWLIRIFNNYLREGNDKTVCLYPLQFSAHCFCFLPNSMLCLFYLQVLPVKWKSLNVKY